MPNSYITPFDYKRAATGQEIDSLIGNLTRLSAGVSVGATSLPLTDVTVAALASYDNITIFDGTSTEVVTVTTAPSPNPGASSVTVSATQFAHAKGVAVCSDGVFGSLSEKLLTASDMIEDITYQQLLLGSHTDTLTLKSMRASVSNEHALTMRIMNFPVQTVTALVATLPGGVQISFDPAKAELNSGQQLVVFRQLLPLGSNGSGGFYQTSLNQRTAGTVTITYTSGYAFNALPYRIKNAAILLTSDELSHRDNRSGAFLTQEGKVKTQYAPTTDTSGQSLLYKKAVDNLSSWIVEPV